MPCDSTVDFFPSATISVAVLLHGVLSHGAEAVGGVDRILGGFFDGAVLGWEGGEVAGGAVADLVEAGQDAGDQLAAAEDRF